MIERDINRRLGSTKSTMFKVGGVAALKQHDFFKELNWQSVFNCELPTPIDLKLDDEVIMGNCPSYHYIIWLLMYMFLGTMEVYNNDFQMSNTSSNDILTPDMLTEAPDHHSIILSSMSSTSPASTG